MIIRDFMKFKIPRQVALSWKISPSEAVGIAFKNTLEQFPPRVYDVDKLDLDPDNYQGDKFIDQKYDFSRKMEYIISNPTTVYPSAVVILAVIIGTIVLVVILNDGHRDVPVQYSQKMNGRRLTGGLASKIPIKVNVANVMPVIFASSLLSLPQMVASFTRKGYGSGISKIILECVNQNNWFNPEKPQYSIGLVFYIVMIYFFAYFYTSISFNPVEVAANLKKSGGRIPGLRPGKPTEEYLSKVISHMVVIGTTCLMGIVFIPTLFNGLFSAKVSFGGTSIIIIVGVTLETLEQIESHMQVRKHEGFLTGNRR